MSNSKRGKIGVRDVDRHKGEEVGEGEQQEGEQPTMCIYNFGFIFWYFLKNCEQPRTFIHYFCFLFHHFFVFSVIVSSLECSFITFVSCFLSMFAFTVIFCCL